ncbi:General alpha-glucoside permease [Cyberlindnera jadinii]|uniref:General alpha-glucoside permease n=1 Tax=Cyberlindnera jadinii (strain ATCC 18201 / CBS 1600 / BCRC 20928 / JCM 3617 / NBRC 0987 / NRRL Y-1542) TaxID=983966 RepID=A0A0H5C866_CYBJN|nr:General alpha-glucoside permease [Cyberlindnera jadinii]
MSNPEHSPLLNLQPTSSGQKDIQDPSSEPIKPPVAPQLPLPSSAFHDSNNVSGASSITSSSLSSLEMSELEDSINPQRSFIYIVLLAIIVGGLQLSWCTEFSEGTPFLLSLGVSKRTLALIWIAGPLSGSLGQPIIGILSDNSENPSGRRKPFIIGGCVATCLSLLYLSYSVDLISLFFPTGTSMTTIKRATIPFASLGVYLLDFSISAIQAASRAYIVDNVATYQQQIANAMAAIMIGGFNIIGYFMGSINLVRFFWFLGNTQFKVLASIASIVLVLVTTVSLWYIDERNPQTDVVIRAERKRNVKRLKELGIDNPTTIGGLIVSLYKQTSHSVTRLSSQVWLVCMAEFFAWIGYFPMLFYTTTYVGDLYKYEFFQARLPSLPPLTQEELQSLQEAATRRGAMALLMHSITSFGLDLLLPLLVKPFIKESLATHEASVLTSSRVEQYISKFRDKYFPVKSRIHKQYNEDSTGHDGTLTVNPVVAERFQNYEHEAGIILGIHNFFVAAPQVISSLFSSFLFHLLSKDTQDGAVYDSSLGWVFRFGGVATFGALWFSLKLKTDRELVAEEEEVFTSSV